MATPGVKAFSLILAFLLYYEAVFKALELINEVLTPKASGPFCEFVYKLWQVRVGRLPHPRPRVSHVEF